MTHDGQHTDNPDLDTYNAGWRNLNRAWGGFRARQREAEERGDSLELPDDLRRELEDRVATEDSYLAKSMLTLSGIVVRDAVGRVFEPERTRPTKTYPRNALGQGRRLTIEEDES
jgi:hypothetical protein